MRWDYKKEATCTQSGLYAYYCQICDYTIEEAAQHVDPLGHDWCWQEDSQMYVCSRCDLMNANGADGEVVLENLTEKRGAGINYVVGYWNKGNVEYIYNIAIVVTDASGNTTDVILDDVFATWYTGEYEAAVFSKAEVERSAGELGYEAGTYEVKFTFVPMYGDGLHDYAITL